MNDVLRTALRIGFGLTGFDPRRAALRARGVERFLRSVRDYRVREVSDGRFPLRLSNLYPILDEFQTQAGSASGHYFHQDLWAARKIYQHRPTSHVDVGSRLDGFVAHLLVFMDVQVVDIRPLSSDVRGLRFVQADAVDMAGFESHSLSSISSLHAVEHFGLGRYGDPVEPDACFRAMRSMARVLAPAGRLYFSVPIGRERVEFNAHRVFAPETVLAAFPGLRLVSFSAVDDAGAFRENALPGSFATAREACGLFEFTKP